MQKNWFLWEHQILLFQFLKNIYQNGYDVTVVYSQPPRKSNRGQKIEKSPVHSFAETISFEVRTLIN